MTSITFQQTMNVLQCASCGIDFAITDDFEQRRRKDKKDFHCPNGHANAYGGESDAAKIKRLQAERDAQFENAENAWRQHDAEKRKRAKVERELKAAKPVVERAKRAVCPAPGCKRQVVQMKRHLDTCHPDFVPEAAHVH